jgi:hypothetical protein
MDHSTNPILCCLEPSERAVVNDDDDEKALLTQQPPEAPVDYADGTTTSSAPMDGNESPVKEMNKDMPDMDEQPYDVMAGMLAETSVSSTAAEDAGGVKNGVITESANIAKDDKNNGAGGGVILPRQDFHTPEFKQRLQEARAEKGQERTSGGSSYNASMDPQDYDAAALQYDDNPLRTPEEDLVLQQELAAQRQAKVDQELQEEQAYKQDQVSVCVCVLIGIHLLFFWREREIFFLFSMTPTFTDDTISLRFDAHHITSSSSFLLSLVCFFSTGCRYGCRCGCRGGNGGRCGWVQERQQQKE